ncbi:hypothetical protein CRUP_037021 [Coryphaenoides rupestris]|nr:hypothetical protein CRUP_037021 [Coryphaenoides rupestris]
MPQWSERPQSSLSMPSSAMWSGCSRGTPGRAAGRRYTRSKRQRLTWEVMRLSSWPRKVVKVGLPAGVLDVWERLGRQEHCRWTWDTKANSNKRVPYVSRCRFDRVYLRPAARPGVPRLQPDHMALLGMDKLDCGRYTSDHWGIYCSFSAG